MTIINMNIYQSIFIRCTGTINIFITCILSFSWILNRILILLGYIRKKNIHEKLNHHTDMFGP